jgi:hypothetical protein
VSAPPDFDSLSLGSSTKQLAFTVRNRGSSRAFNITVSDAHRFVSRVAPKELLLGAGESGTIRVDLAAPPGTTPGFGDALVVVAASTSAPATSHFSVVHFYVAAPASAPTDLR